MSDAVQRVKDVDLVFRALASEPRRQILMVLHFRGGEVPAGEVQDRFGCTWATTSRHLKVLADAGLVTVRAEGRSRLYAVNYERIEVARHWLGFLRARED